MKKIFSIVLGALVALAVFTGCEYSGEFDSGDAIDTELDLSTATVGYNLTAEVDDDGILVITSTGDYSQSAIEFPYMGYPKAKITYKSDAQLTVGFLLDGASPWDGRIAGADTNPAASDSYKTITVDVPSTAKYISIAPNGVTGAEIDVKSIVLTLGE